MKELLLLKWACLTKFQENSLMALFLRLVAEGVICVDHISLR